MEITFPGGLAVEARHRGFTVRTDQPGEAGGGNSAPAPFELFLISMGTCAGYFALRFCQKREIDTAGMRLELDTEADEETHKLTAVKILLHLPEGFPEKYRDAIARSAEQCTVKRALFDPPRFEVAVAEADPAGH